MIPGTPIITAELGYARVRMDMYQGSNPGHYTLTARTRETNKVALSSFCEVDGDWTLQVPPRVVPSSCAAEI